MEIANRQRKVLWLFSHPNIRNSKANARIFSKVRAIPSVTTRDLYELYPTFWIDVAAEQALLAEHDMVVLQHPFYWYSMPPLMKLWLDEVLLYNFAYGPQGNALKDKLFLLALTTGGPKESYATESYNHFPIATFLPPYIQTALLCRMHWQEPFILHDAHRASPEHVDRHSERIVAFLNSYLNGEKL